MGLVKLSDARTAKMLEFEVWTRFKMLAPYFEDAQRTLVQREHFQLRLIYSGLVAEGSRMR